MTFDWAAHESDLPGYIADGMSMSAIAAKIGTTKSAVSGKVNRHGLGKGNMKWAEKDKETFFRMKAAGATWRAIATHFGKSYVGCKSAWRRWQNSSIAPTPFIPLADLGPRDCRYPIGDPAIPGFGFCGDLVQEGSSYCRKHHILTHKRKVA